ncbi:MAG: LamG domain-containing protein [Deltaproteobacteria bacterium]|nr:LamG domain-containing protein [Deltaproteobacteria bacterium]
MPGYLYQFPEAGPLTQLSASFATSLRDRASLRKAAGAGVDAWASYAGIGGLRRFGLTRVMTRPGASADTCILDASTEWRDRLLVVAAFHHPVLATGPAAWPGHPNDADFESLGWFVGYTRDGVNIGQSVAAQHIRLATGVHLFAVGTAAPDAKEGALALEVAPTAGHERMTIGLVIWASERLGIRYTAPSAVPALLASDGQTIAPADLNLLQDPAMLVQLRGGNAVVAGSWLDSDCIPLGPQARPDRGLVGPAIPATGTRRTNDWSATLGAFVAREQRQALVGSHKRFFGATLANGVERLVDSSIDWRQRFLSGMGRVHTSEIRPGEAGDMNHNGASSWDAAGFTGPGLRAPRVASMTFSGGAPTGYVVAAPNHAVFLDAAKKVALFADSSDGALYVRNDAGGTRYVTGFVEATEPVGQSRLPDLYGFGDWCLSFDGTDDYVSIPDASSLSNAVAFSFDCWFKQDASSGFRCIASHGPDPASAFVVCMDTGPVLQVRLSTTTIYGECTAPSTGVWHHLCVVYQGGGATDADKLQVYVDGVAQVLAFTGTIPATLPDVAQAVELGRWAGPSGYWNGDLNEIAWYAFSLTASEAAQNYQRRRVIRGLTSLWKLDEGTGTSIADDAATISGWAASPANTGTINGATWVAPA